MQASTVDGLFIDALVKEILIDFGLVIDDEPTPDAKVLVGGEQVAVLAEHTEAHAVGVGLEDLVPAPEHVAVHVVMDSVVARQQERLAFDDGIIPRGDRAGVYGFGVAGG